jgi:hypothetical protein
MEYKFRIGQMVRIGNECSATDTNYHKRGKIVAVDEEGQIIVDMIDPFSHGEIHISWCPNWLWEPCSDQICCKSLL